MYLLNFNVISAGPALFSMTAISAPEKIKN